VARDPSGPASFRKQVLKKQVHNTNQIGLRKQPFFCRAELCPAPSVPHRLCRTACAAPPVPHRLCLCRT